jgi:pyruvate,orthophosphate dikinase
MGMEIKTDEAAIESDALKANLLETAGTVEIEGELHLLLDIVEPFKGLHSTLEKLLYEVCHPFRNWKLVLPQLRSFALKNINYYRNDPRGPEAFRLFARLFMEALHDTARDPQLLSVSVSAVMTWLDKTLQKFTTADLERLGRS